MAREKGLKRLTDGERSDGWIRKKVMFRTPGEKEKRCA